MSKRILHIGVLGITGRVGGLLQQNIAHDDECLLSSVLIKNTDHNTPLPSSCIVTDDYEEFLKKL